VSAAVESFDAYYHRDHRSLIGLAYVLTGDEAVSQDLVQEALTAAHKNWATVSGYDNPGAWVRRVLVNKSTSRFRKARTEAKMLTRMRSLRQEPVLAPSAKSDEVWSAIRALPRRQAQAIALLYWDDLSISEIANVMECGTETVKTHLSRGRATLAERLSPLREDLP
jgi:RNA polymerase sigma-70 factor (ECF subfamily)